MKDRIIVAIAKSSVTLIVISLHCIKNRITHVKINVAAAKTDFRGIALPRYFEAMLLSVATFLTI